ncbi:carboxymuconolactone decarboxylase family protein [Rhodococcus sp. WS1]|uniref:carboxymuconolactone decarboxylase family protein n=1 Tax=unclassified Rhodococcus (in: high G+C Gram-positive bacteria) TaxID=192944 RepID=UPI001142F300|nr:MULTISPECIES: carboxymuconolactone decarboxylase family protein [unclassified Rhodococcus (in: high G+C Gram-positive bacteria)]ROZ52887.1 carboxymuconolactone decarboxylase family protein [Rhodococcus sp. WS1]TQC35979.1 carboxymuconolactone decarboxylase family protein [Rhodococcus sp. WS7]
MSELRFPPIGATEMTPRQLEVNEAIAGGPRGGLRGPYLALIHHPDLADVVQQMGAHLRFKSALPLPLIELAILVVARHWTCQYEWVAHERVARTTTDLPEHIIEAIQSGTIPDPMSDEQRIVHDFAVRTIKYGEPRDSVYDQAVEKFGRDGVLDLLATCGYYSMIAMLLNTTRVPLPSGTSAPLPEKM